MDDAYRPLDANETLAEARARNVCDALREDVGTGDWTARLVPSGPARATRRPSTKGTHRLGMSPRVVGSEQSQVRRLSAARRHAVRRRADGVLSIEVGVPGQVTLRHRVKVTYGR